MGEHCHLYQEADGNDMGGVEIRLTTNNQTYFFSFSLLATEYPRSSHAL